MTLLGWVEYCRNRLVDTHTADELNFAPEFAWLREGEEGNCDNCNPWNCIACCDGFGMSCGKNKDLWYYIPDPFDNSEECGRKDWKEMVKSLPSPYGEQLTLF